MHQLHPDLAHIANRYDEIVDAWSAGRIQPEEGQAQLAALVVTDASGAQWRIDPATAEWQRSGAAGMWHPADPAEYQEATQTQVDDWSHPGLGAGEYWEDGEPHPLPGETPSGWGEGDHPTWQPPVTAGRNQQAVYPASYGAYDNLDGPGPAGYTADGYPIHEGYDDEGGEGLVDRLRGMFGGIMGSRVGKIALAVVGVLILAIVVKGMLGGGRECPPLAEGITVQDATDENRGSIECVLAAEMMLVASFDQNTGLATFAESQELNRRDLARSLGLSYVALGGADVSSPLPPDEADLDPAAARTRTSAITAYALGLIEGSVATTTPVSVDETVLAVARLAHIMGLEGNTSDSFLFLADAGIIEKDLAAASGMNATRGDLARWLANLYQTGLAVVEESASPGVTLPGETPGSTQGSTPTTAPSGAPAPTSAEVDALMQLVMSGDRGIAAGAIANPGNANVVALRTAELAGFSNTGMAVRSGAPAADGEGKILVTLEAYDTSSDAVMATAVVQVVQVEGNLRLASWPEFSAEG